MKRMARGPRACSTEAVKAPGRDFSPYTSMLSAALIHVGRRRREGRERKEAEGEGEDQERDKEEKRKEDREGREEREREAWRFL